MSLRPLWSALTTFIRRVTSIRSLWPVLITGIVAAASVFGLYVFLSPERYMRAPWLPQVVVTLIGLVGASWFAYRRLELLDEGNRQHKQTADGQLTATERGNLNSAIKEADAMMSKHALSSIIAGQRWLHHLAEDDRLDVGLIRSLLCAYIVSSDPASTSHDVNTDGDRISDETKRQTRQAALEMLFGSPGRDRYSHCQDKPELGSCTWDGLNFTELRIENVNFREGNFINAKISGARFDGCDLRETKWSGTVGGSARTSMRDVEMCGAVAKTCRFNNIDLRGANMGNNGQITRLIHCTFNDCDFTDAKWDGTEFQNANFDGCTGITFDLCKAASNLKGSSGLPENVRDELRRKGLAGYGKPDVGRDRSEKRHVDQQ